MIDRRFLVGALGALLGLTATEALAATRKKKPAAKKTSKKSKSRKTTRKTKARAAPRKAAPPPKPIEPPVPGVTPPEVAAALKSAFDAILRDMLIASPALATYAGLDKGEYVALKSKLDDRSAAGQAAHVTRLKRAVDRLNAISRMQLAASDRVNYDAVLWDNSNQLVLARNFSFGDSAPCGGLWSGGFPHP